MPFYMYSMELPSLLRKIGLKQKEVKTYLTAVSLGSQPASIIAEKAGLNRVTTYMTLKNLVHKGLAQTCQRNGMQFFSVSSPQKLLDFASQKEDEWKETKAKLAHAIMTMEIPTYQNLSPIEVHSFQGIEGFKNLMQTITRADSIFIVSNMDTAKGSYVPYMVEYLFPKLAKLSIELEIVLKKSDYAQKAITVFDTNSKASIYQIAKLPLDTDIFILDRKWTVFIERKLDIVSGAIIESPSISKNLDFSFRTLLGI